MVVEQLSMQKDFGGKILEIDLVHTHIQRFGHSCKFFNEGSIVDKVPKFNSYHFK